MNFRTRRACSGCSTYVSSGGIPSCNARAWANIVHGIAKCKLRRGIFSEVSRLFAAVGTAAVGSRLRDFNPQELANT
eukprot:2600028-Prymnesium_polylepis.1